MALYSHLTRLETRSIGSPIWSGGDPESDITEKVRRPLESWTENEKVDSWESLWMLLFPDDGPDDVPSPFWEEFITLSEEVAK